jgi:hypothetical protein
MQAEALGFTLLAILAGFALLAFLISRVEGLALFAPRSSIHMAATVGAFCTDRCRLPNGECPLSGSVEPAANCPLWQFVADDRPTRLHGSPFESVRPI